MGILGLQRQAAQAGRIRLGHTMSGVSKAGKAYTRPAKLDCFRMTTASRHAADAVAVLLGGEVKAWEGGPSKGLWEVFTERSEVGVIIPPGPKAIDSWYEMWAPKMCVRRCDGETEQLSQKPCLCPSDLDRRAALAGKGEACRMTTRIQLMIPDLPGVGVWMLESHGYYAAVEMTGVAEMLAAVGSRQGMPVPAQLRIEQRERRIFKGEGNAPEQRSYPVPVLEPLVSMREIAAAVESGVPLAAALPPPVRPVRVAIASGSPVQRPAIGQGPGGFAEAGCTAPTIDDLRLVWRHATEAGCMDAEVVVPGSDEITSLRELLERCAADLEQGVMA